MNDQTRDALWDQAKSMKLTLNGKSAKLGPPYLRSALIIDEAKNIAYTVSWDTFAAVLISNGGHFTV